MRKIHKEYLFAGRKKKQFSNSRLKSKMQNINTSEVMFTELEEMVGSQQQIYLEGGNYCNCKLCSKSEQNIIKKEDLYESSSPEAHLNFFRLLQHLTMIETGQAPIILGQLNIPMLFFKKKPKTIQHQNNLNQKQNFILFQNNLKNGILQAPISIKSIGKAMQIMKEKQESMRKNRNKKKVQKEQSKRVESTYEEMNESKNFIHSKLFDEAIPSYYPASAISVSPQSQSKFILHQDNRFVNQQFEGHKLRSSQPFCVFRYSTEQECSENKKVSKYEIFTMEILELYQKNKLSLEARQKNNKQSLNLICIENYIRIKTKPQKSIHFSEANAINKQKELQQTLSVIHFSQFSRQKSELRKCQIWKLAELEVKIRSGKISNIDPQFLDFIDLSLRIESVLGLNQPISSEKIQKLIKYKTYKIVNVLQVVCRVIVQNLKLKWLVNEEDEIVLVECLEYKIDRAKCHQPRKNRDMHIEYILDHGLSMLDENNGIEQMGNSMNHRQNIEEMIRIRKQYLKELKQSNYIDQKRIYVQSPLGLIRKYSQICGRKKIKSVNLTPFVNKKHSFELRRSVPEINLSRSSSISLILSQKKKDFIDKLSQIKLSTDVSQKSMKDVLLNRYRCKLRKSFKLKPFKTESSAQN